VARTRVVAIGQSATLALCFWSSRADALGFPNANVWMPVGLSTGYAVHDDPANGGLFGGELSIAHITDTGLWYGGYLDFIHDFGSDTERLSVGPEIGWNYLGVDAGFVLENGDRLRPGVALRPLLTMGIASLGIRGVKTFGDGGGAFVELGFLLKIPFPIADVGETNPDSERGEP
jgi:hypothetical protein